MSEKTPSIEKLEKQLRVLKKKLERSEWHRVDLENQHDRDQHLYRRLHADLEAARREAEIKAALERVRTKAMAMQKPEDLSGISETVFTELRALGFTDLRNTEIIINHDAESSITSYYYSDYGVTGVIDVDYRTNPTLEAWARDMQKADDAFAEVVIAEDDIEDWRAYRLSLGYVPDPKLDEATTVHYYSYSIGLGALSISSFQPVSAGQLNVLEQFRNVFNLAYQRYVDIARAQTQAREAQIQLALERIRAQSMLMQHSSELVATSAVFHEQLQALGVPTEFSYVWLPDEAAGKHQFWATWTEEEDGAPVHRSKAITYDLDKEEPYTAACFAAWESEERLFVDFIPPSDIGHFFGTWEELVGGAEHLRPERFPDGIYYAEGYMKYGCFGINIRREPTETEQGILRRFAVEFERAYTRFLDLGRAEAQAREAQIEAALERVRSRTMAMHESAELGDVIQVVFREALRLGFGAMACDLVILDETTDGSTFWISGELDEADEALHFRVPPLEHPHYTEGLVAWRNGETVRQIILEGEVCAAYMQQLTEAAEDSNVPDEVEAFIQRLRYIVHTEAYMRYGYFRVASLAPLGETAQLILRRFARVFEQTYTRFLDLKQAEAQAREAQIEASLERVRARAMAMHRSDDVGAAVHTMFEELRGLGLETMRCGLGLIDGETRRVHLYTTVSSEKGVALQQLGNILLAEDPIAANIYAHWQRGEEYFPVLQGETLRNYHKHLKPGLDVPDWHADYAQYGFFIFFSEFAGGLYGWSDKAYAEADLHILRRFASVLGLTYRRYLDIQQAEAQAREAQIEASLERVRARAMAMHSSDDLSDATAIVFEELERLGITTHRCGINIIHDSGHMDLWTATATEDNSDLRVLGRLDSTMHPMLNGVFEAWKVRQPYFTYGLEGEDMQTYYQALKDAPEYAFPKDANPSESHFAHLFNFPEGSLFAFTEQPLAEETIQVVQRFAAVFALTYRRYLDLKQAEEQAREAQIEAALEKVRSRTMAMRKPDELQEVVTVVAEKLQDLGVIMDAGGVIICTYFPHSKDVVHWLASSDFSSSKPYLLPYFDHRIFEEAWHSRESGDAFFSRAYSVEEKNSFFLHAFEHSDYKYFPDDFKEWVIAAEHHALTFAWSKNAAILIPSFTDIFPSESDKEILKRFANVFEQAYVRFLDLQQAEEQAREAQIEAALERVRAKTMAMHTSDELLITAQIVYHQLEGLGLISPLSDFEIGILDEETGEVTVWQTDLSLTGTPSSLSLFFTDVAPVADEFQRWRQTPPEARKDLHIVNEYTGEVLQETLQFLLAQPGWAEAVQLFQEAEITHWVTHHAYFSHGLLALQGPAVLDEQSQRVLKRFASVFEQTYTRYLDLQQAEVRAREAEQQASVDRVRAVIASMRTTDDLQHITPLIWRELIALGVPFFRCGVFIMDEATEQMQAFLTDPDGKPLVALELPYDISPTTQAAVVHWHQRQIYTDVWDQEQFVAWTQTIAQSGLIETTDAYQGASAPPETLALHFVPFEQGMLYVGSTAPLSEEAVELVQALADAFAVAYARYEDFQRLEAKNREVEAAMDELKATQQQLVQSEKMASLGALTAGIAHEIKNPLNFVNNFAALSQDLVDELEVETDPAEIQAILADLKLNAAKIEEHGKRADSIVRSMMQHARAGSGERETVALNKFVDEYVDLSWHGKRAQTPDFNAEVVRDYDEAVGRIDVVPQDLGRVLINLLSNAFDAVYEHTVQTNGQYAPQVTVSTRQEGSQLAIRVADNGPGIPAEVREKIFEPFFTTKPTGQGTGLGLSLSFDIITQGHSGTLAVESTPGHGAAFVITLPG